LRTLRPRRRGSLAGRWPALTRIDLAAAVQRRAATEVSTPAADRNAARERPGLADSDRPFSVIHPTKPTVGFAATADVQVGTARVGDRPQPAARLHSSLGEAHSFLICTHLHALAVPPRPSRSIVKPLRRHGGLLSLATCFRGASFKAIARKPCADQLGVYRQRRKSNTGRGC
jgi:hypothetical protein